MAPSDEVTSQVGSYDLLERYVAALGRRLRGRRDRIDVVAEVTDHLWLATDERVAGGQDPDEAQRAVLARFGDARSVAVALATSPSGGLVAPTHVTRAAGAAAVASAAGYLLFSIPTLVAGVTQWMGWDALGGVSNHAFTLVNVLVLPVMAVAIVGLLLRSGTSRSDPVLVATVVAGAASPVLGVLFHEGIELGWPALGLALQLGPTVLAAVALRRLADVGIATLRTDWLLPTAFPIGLALGLVLMPLAPTLDGDAPAGLMVGLAVYPILFAVGLMRRGLWLGSEPAPLAEQPVLEPLDLRWGSVAVMAIVVGLAGIAQALGYAVASAIGFSRFLYVELPGPAVTAAALATVMLPAGLAAARTAGLRAPG